MKVKKIRPGLYQEKMIQNGVTVTYQVERNDGNWSYPVNDWVTRVIVQDEDLGVSDTSFSSKKAAQMSIEQLQSGRWEKDGYLGWCYYD